MTTFYVLNDGKKKQCTAVNAEKATEMLNLMFPGQKAFIVDGGKVPFAQNMTIAEAEHTVGITPTVVTEPVVTEPLVAEPVIQTIELLPEETVTVKPAKTKVKSKVVVKSAPTKKTKVKAKVTVQKPKKPVAKGKPVSKKSTVKRKVAVVKKQTAKKPVAKKPVKKK